MTMSFVDHSMMSFISFAFSFAFAEGGKLIRKVGGVILINDKEGAGFRMQGRREANEKTLREARGVLTVPPPCISVLTTNTLLKTTNNIDRHK